MTTIFKAKMDQTIADFEINSDGIPKSSEIENDAIIPSVSSATSLSSTTAEESADTTKQLEEPSPKIEPLIRLSSTRKPHRDFKVLQQWEGIITEVTETSVWARIHDLTNPSGPSEIVELPINEISVEDHALLENGNVFYWIIGYEYGKGGQVRRVSEIRLRRTPQWSHQNVEKAMKKGADYFRKFMEHDENHSSRSE